MMLDTEPQNLPAGVAGAAGAPPGRRAAPPAPAESAAAPKPAGLAPRALPAAAGCAGRAALRPASEAPDAAEADWPLRSVAFAPRRPVQLALRESAAPPPPPAAPPALGFTSDAVRPFCSELCSGGPSGRGPEPPFATCSAACGPCHPPPLSSSPAPPSSSPTDPGGGREEGGALLGGTRYWASASTG